MTDWSEIARQTIARAAQAIPDTATFEERKAAIFAAYPFGERERWPYKAWLKAQKAYLRRYDPAIPPTALPFADLPRDPATGRPVIR